MEVGAARCLEFLDVSGTTLCHASACAIASIASLTHLSMAGCTGCATMEGFSRLPNLTSLDISHTALSAGALASLGDACQLRELRLARLAMTVDPSVLSALTSLEVLDLSDSRVVGSGHIEALLGLAHLRHLDVSMCPMIGDELPNLTQVKSLQVLDVRMSTTDAETVAALRETIPVVRARLTYPGGGRYW